jgi:hypothetical protein
MDRHEIKGRDELDKMEATRKTKGNGSLEIQEYIPIWEGIDNKKSMLSHFLKWPLVTKHVKKLYRASIHKRMDKKPIKQILQWINVLESRCSL